MKIEEIVLNNYRAFCNQPGEETDRYRIDLSGGKNLLIYGENGSGKSSLFKAFKDFFLSASNKDLPFSKNIFSDDFALKEQPYIRISFNDGSAVSPYYFSSDFAKINTDVDFLKEAGKTKSFMSYRELMKIHFIDQNDVNLFSFLIDTGGLLADIPNPASTVPETKLTLSELWGKLCEAPDDTLLNDFNNGVGMQLSELTKYLNKLLTYFDNRFEASFEFNPLSIEDVSKKEGVIGLKVIYCKKEIKQYHLFLNEARLTAVAISIYLAAHLSVPSGQYEILFLDDVFTGLDTSNRLPLLKILSAPTITGDPNDTFLKHQIFLTTYDRQWFDLARQHLGSNWNPIELFVGELSDNYTIRPILIDPAHDYLQRAWTYYESRDYPACANYQRRECERLLKGFLPSNYKYTLDSDNNIKPVNKLGQLFDNLQRYCKENKLDIKVLDEFRNYSKVVLNPLSHDDLESPAYRRELEEVFKMIDEFKKLKNVLKLKAGTVLKFEKEHGKTKTKYHYEFEVRTDVRLISLGANTAMTPLTVLPIKIKKMGKQGERIALFRHKLLERVSKVLKLSKKPTELDIRSAPLNKMHEVVLKFLQVDKTLEAIDEFYIEKNNLQISVRSILENP